MNTKGFGLIRILVIANILYSFPLFAQSAGGKASAINIPPIVLGSDRCENLNGEAKTRCQKLQELKDCKEVRSGFDSMKTVLKEGCAGSGFSGAECVERARSCAGAQAVNPMSSLIGVDIATNICSTKVQNDRAIEKQKDQQDKLDEKQKDIADRYRESQKELNDVMKSQYDTLMDVSNRVKEMRDQSIEIPYQSQQLERQMRKDLMSSKEEYTGKTIQLALLNKEILRLNNQLGDLPTGFLDVCQTQFRDDAEAARIEQLTVRKSIESSLKETSGGSTIDGYQKGLTVAKAEYAELTKTLERKNKNRYMDCLKAKQKEYKAKYDELKSTIEKQEASKTVLEANMNTHLTNMATGLEKARSDINKTLALGNSDMTARGEQIFLLRQQYNTSLNAAIQSVQSAQAEMAQFQSQFESQQRMKMIGGMYSMLTGGGGGALGDVYQIVNDYDEYAAEMELSGCNGGSSGNLAGGRYGSSGGR